MNGKCNQLNRPHPSATHTHSLSIPPQRAELGPAIGIDPTADAAPELGLAVSVPYDPTPLSLSSGIISPAPLPKLGWRMS